MNKVEVKVVIGANYGDEGKGLAAHYFSQKAKEEHKSCLNVLFNGGCQRGHTVELKDGTRHIFHHFGSGFFDGAHTYFDQNFMVNPSAFMSERKRLRTEMQEFGNNLPVYISPKCRVITPYDIYINQIVEKSRGNDRHGSCGWGIWETQRRYEDSVFNLTFEELINKTDCELLEYMKDITVEYIPKRLEYYGITEIDEYYNMCIKSFNIARWFIRSLREMQECVKLASFDELRHKYDVIVFEGAQGLELDEDNEKAYPHVTASSTTSRIPMERIKDFNCNVEICYISRSYFTRHGAGPLTNECHISKINPKIEDLTNVHNDYQENIRYGHFNTIEFLRRVYRDSKTSLKIKPLAKISIMLTHLNYNTTDSEDYKIADRIICNCDKLYTSRTKFAEDITSMPGIRGFLI